MGGKAGGIGYGDDVSPTLTDSSAHQPAVAFAQNTRDEVRLVNGDGQLAGALAAQPGAKQQTYVAYAMRMREGKPGGGKGPLVSEDVSLTLATGSDQTLFVNSAGTDLVGALCLSDEKGQGSQYVNDGKLIGCRDAEGWTVRRLTPLECERLQGFPDDWTAIPGAKDGPRYKAIGNSMAVPVMRWIGERIAEVDSIGEVDG